MSRMNFLSFLGRRSVAMVGLVLMLAMSASIGSAGTASAQAISPDGIWSDIAQSRLAAQGADVPTGYRALSLNASALRLRLQSAPLEGSAAAERTQTILTLPLPDGSFGRFQIVDSPIMEPGLAAKFPEMKSYAGQGIDDPTATVRMDWTPAGFHAMILSATDTIYIDPVNRNDTVHYVSYAKRDFQLPDGKVFRELSPLVSGAASVGTEANKPVSTVNARPQSAGTQLRTYRLAMAANGEYTQFQGGTKADALASILTTVNRVDAIYEHEVAVRLILVANNDLLIYTDPATDPYTNNNTEALLEENQTNIDAVIGTANYDIGHVLTTATDGGLAGLGVVCDATSKATGESGMDSPSGDPFIVDFVAHEIGHQFGAEHIFNSAEKGCVGPRTASNAYEPGSGTTIMGYAGVCGEDDVQPHNDPFFNSANFEQIVAFTTTGGGNDCAVITETGNAVPVVDAGPGGFTIPAQTPFTLTGSATDANDDALTYSWEEHDLGPVASLANSDPTNPPFFRSFAPVTSPSRTFPRWTDILSNTTTIGEILPNATLTMTFRLTARDNRANGSGVNYASTSFGVTTAAGPFLVTAPNTALTWAGNSTQDVTWDVANTDVAPVSCANVTILLSTDGGYTYPTTLAASVPNNGSASVTVPNMATTTARVQVACADNIFFDVSNTEFAITASTEFSEFIFLPMISK